MMRSSSPSPSCELCSSLASLFCPSDSAFLCCSCDALVHHANFLVARHFRHLLCSICHHFSGQGLSGRLHRPSPTTCPSCPPPPSSSQECHLLQDPLSSSAHSSSVCSSTDEFTNHNNNNCNGTPPRVDYSNFKATAEAERIFVDWCSKLGVIADLGVLRTACRVLRLTVFPFHACLAACIWVGLRGKYCRRRPGKVILKRLEEISGVPAKIILAAQWKLECALRQHRQRRLQLLAEGWAES